MKTLTKLVLCLVLCVSVARAEVPLIVSSGFDAYKASGSKEALSIWLRGGAPSAGVSLEGMPPDIGPGMEKPGAFGPMESYEVIAVFSPALRVRRVYAVAYFPQGPLFFCFDLYKAPGAWVTYGLNINIVPDRVLPVELLEKQG